MIYEIKLTVPILYCVCISGGGVYTWQKCLPPSCLFCCYRNQKTVPRGEVVTLGVYGFYCLYAAILCVPDTDNKHACLYYTIPVKLLGSLISDFVDSFRPTARINSICGRGHLETLLLWVLIHNKLIYASMCVFTGRCSLLPVVNNSGAICNSWKLDPSTLHFPLKGMLPFDKVTCLDYTFHWGDIIGQAQNLIFPYHTRNCLSLKLVCCAMC